jgi:hypothetical protein
MKITETEELDLLLIQEPYEHQNKPVGIVKKNNIYCRNRETAAIIVINS